jgi:RNA polymerase sigma factor (TIGR02999 family)
MARLPPRPAGDRDDRAAPPSDPALAPTGTAGGVATMVQLTYGRLRQLAAGYLRRERPDHTLQPTALVHEAYLRLSDAERRRWHSRAHFLSFAARVMRQVLVDEARRKGYRKRRPPGGVAVADPADAGPEAERRGVDVLDLDRVLGDLEAYDPRKAAIVQLRFFGGLTVPETSLVLELSVATVNREWRAARAWLGKALEELGGEGRHRPGREPPR